MTKHRARLCQHCRTLGILAVRCRAFGEEATTSMEFDTAKNLMEKIRAADAIFAALSRDIDKMSESERTKIMRGSGSTMAEIYARLIEPIGHPSLDPTLKCNSQAMSATVRQALPFAPLPGARASLKPGALYAIDGDDGFIYYGQVTPEKSIGFFRIRSEVVSIPAALSAQVMSRFLVGYSSIGRAVRSGKWLSLGPHPIHTGLCDQAATVQWPVGTTEVTIWKGGVSIGTTQVHDPDIQDLEIIAAYDAEFHVPERLRLDYSGSGDAWSVGGSIRRERLKKQALARKFPDVPWHQLPSDWVPVEVRKR